MCIKVRAISTWKLIYVTLPSFSVTYIAVRAVQDGQLKLNLSKNNFFIFFIASDGLSNNLSKNPY